MTQRGGVQINTRIYAERDRYKKALEEIVNIHKVGSDRSDWMLEIAEQALEKDDENCNSSNEG